MERRNSNSQLLEELEALSQTLNNTNTCSVASTSKGRRTNSLVLTRTSIPPILSSQQEQDPQDPQDGLKLNPKPRSRRMSLSPWRSRPSEQQQGSKDKLLLVQSASSSASASASKGGGGGGGRLWNWKPIRALSNLGKQKLSCLLSVEVVSIQGLPPSMNGLRLSVSVRKKDTRDGAVQTMPSRVSQGAADFEETLFLRCHVYCLPAGNLQPRLFLIHAFAVDAQDLDFGRHTLDLSHLIQESVTSLNQLEGRRLRQWDMTFSLSGKAKGGELLVKLGFQIIHKDANAIKLSAKSNTFSPSLGRKQSRSSFSILSPRVLTRPKSKQDVDDLQSIDDLNLDAPPNNTTHQHSLEEDHIPDFEVVDKGVELQHKLHHTDSEDNHSDKRSVSSEVVKEMVHHDHRHLTRLSELDSIAQQIKALESMMRDQKKHHNDEDINTESQRLDEDEDKVTREFLQMLENDHGNNNDDRKQNAFQGRDANTSTASSLDGEDEGESKVYIPDLSKGLGCVIQTRNGGYLVSMNPFDTLVANKDTPKLTMQISRPMVLASSNTGTEMFQQMAALGFERLSSEILSLMPMEELHGKTAEQIAFEGIASAIISGRSKEGATCSAARAVTVVKSMATGMTRARQERISSGIWNMNESPLTGDEVLAYSLQKMEEMAVEALKVHAGVTGENAPFDVPPSDSSNGNPFTNAIPLEDWMKDNSVVTSYDKGNEPITISVVVQLRDPLREYEAVGGPLIALIHATSVEAEANQEKKFKVGGLNIGGLKVRSGVSKKNEWDTEKQRLTAMQWLLAYGLGKGVKKGKRVMVKGPDMLWSMSSRVMADMWLKSIRNPDVKFTP